MISRVDLDNRVYQRPECLQSFQHISLITVKLFVQGAIWMVLRHDEPLGNIVMKKF